jgi:hypothetical protein
MPDTRRPVRPPRASPWEQAQVDRARRQLAGEFPRLPPTVVDRVVAQATSDLRALPRRTYVPQLVEATARRELAARAYADAVHRRHPPHAGRLPRRAR